MTTFDAGPDLDEPLAPPGPGAPACDATGLAGLVRRIAACRVCVESPRGLPLPHAPRPVVRVGEGSARLLVCGQAPGARVHASGLPFDDPSGARLREWMELTPEEFYDEGRVAIVPMGFCFPGLDAKGSDKPPRPECAATWHDRLFALMPRPDLIVALGLHAQRYHLRRLGRPDLIGPSLSDMAGRWREILEQTGILPLPHPSWRTRAWVARHPWFDTEVLPVLRERVRAAIAPVSTRTGRGAS